MAIAEPVAAAEPATAGERDGGLEFSGEDCEFRESTPIEGKSPLPGLTVYPQAGAHAHRWYLAGDHALLLPHSDTNPPPSPAVLVPLRGGVARAFPIKRLERFEQYLARGHDIAGSRQQPGILLLAPPDDPCFPAGLHAFEPQGFRRIFQYSEGAAWPRHGAFAPAVGWHYGDRFLMRALTRSNDAEARLALFDVTSGKPLWQRQTTNGFVTFANGRALHAHDGIYEVALADGRETRLWARSPVPPLTMSASASHVAFVVPNEGVHRPREWTCPNDDENGKDRCEYSLVILDRAGKARPILRVPRPRSSMAQVLSVENDVFVAFHTEIRGIVHSLVVAIDAPSGRERWRTRPVPCGGTWAMMLDAGGSELYFVPCSDVIQKLDRKTGKLNGEFGIGWYEEVAVSDNTIVFVTQQHVGLPVTGLSILDSSALSSPEGETLVQGKVADVAGAPWKSPVWVRIGSELVRTDAAGRFRQRVRGRGWLSADVVSVPGLLFSWTSTNAIFGFDRPEHEIALEIQVTR